MKILMLYIFITSFIFYSLGLSQTILFQDDFEDGNALNWEYSQGWRVVLDDTNYVFEGRDHNWAKPPIDYYSNATFQTKFKLIQGGFHFNILFRYERYYFPIHPTFIQFFAEGSYISGLSYEINEGIWHTARVSLEKNKMNFYLDDSLLFEYEDQNRPVLFGKLALECINHIYVDDVLITGAMTHEQKAKWFRTGGPLGGIGYDVRVDPSDPDIIYVTDQWAGCHKSNDGGKTWHPKNYGITSRFGPTGDSIPIFCLTVDPNNPNIVWCGTFGMRGVYRSTDKGEHWELKVNGIPNTERLTFRSFAIEPGNSKVVYCGTEWALWGDEIPVGQSSASKGKVYKTIDSGENWSEVLDSDALVRTIIIDPTNTNIVYAATGIFDRDDIKEEGIWKSTDAGATWFHINNGISNLTIGDIEMHPSNPNILLAAAGRLNGFGGGYNAEMGEILRTTDGGITWKRSYGGHQGQPFTYVEFDESNPNIVYAAASDRGFFKSTNGGISFFQTTYNPPYVNPGHIISIATHKDRPDWLITNSYGGGVFVSDDGAMSWHDASKGYTGCEVADIAVAANDPLLIYAVARSSVFKSEDGGNNWQGIGAMWTQHNNVPIGPLEMRSIAIHPNNPYIVVATDQERKIFKTINGGKTWRKVFELPAHELKTIVYAPSNLQILYAGATVPGGYQIDRPFPFDPTQPSYGMLKSIDGGESWRFINNGLDATYKNINHITVHPTNPDIVYIGKLNSGVYKSVDGGSNWFKSSNGILVPDIRSIAIDYSNPDIIYAGAQRGGIYKSVDGGQNWQTIIYGMDSEAAIRSIVIHPQNSQIIYAGDWFSGVYRSLDGGQTWYHINEGLRTRAVQKLAISNDGNFLYAATQGEGVFRLVFEQLPPQIQFIQPDTSQVIKIIKGDSMQFSITAFDPNNDLLSYHWFLNSVLIPEAQTDQYLWKSDTMTTGQYELSIFVTDSVFSTKAAWQIQIVPPTAIDSELKNSLIEYQLFPNYPNPFNSITTIKFAVKNPSKVELVVYDMLGREIKRLVNNYFFPGYYQSIFDAGDLASGIYFYEIKMGEFKRVKKALVLK